MLLGHFFSLELSSKEQQSQSTARLKLRKLMTAILERITFEDDIPKGLLKDSGLLMDLMGSQGAVLCFDGRMTLLGKTPDKEKVIALIEWMDKYNRKKAFASDCLMGLYPPAQEFKDTASGIIAVPIPKAANDYIIWFRPEHVHDLTWAGNPHEPVVAGNERSKFNPRNSFESWKEILKFKSLPWEPVQIEAAHEIYDMISGLILKKHLLTQIRAGKEMDKL
jgi:light-regulated signal transduction histidine kinase (bacteriophytochrome)